MGIAAVVGGYSTAAYGFAFTECTSEGIRTRGLAGPRVCRWADVANITPRLGRTRSVMVTTNSGRRFFLGAPVSSPVMRDPLFLNRVDQIISYWGRAIEDFLKPEDRATSDPALRARQTTARPGTRKAGPGRPGPYLRFLRLLGWLAAVGLLVLGAVLLFFGIRDVGPSWAAHLGHGVPGVFTATRPRQWQDCTQTCRTATEWFGTFTSRYGTRAGVPINADGAHITTIGQQEAVLYESNGFVYANGGGVDWLLTTLMVVGGIALVGFSAIRGLRALARRKALKDPPGWA
jgi:hypothetical protein